MEDHIKMFESLIEYCKESGDTIVKMNFEYELAIVQDEDGCSRLTLDWDREENKWNHF